MNTKEALTFVRSAMHKQWVSVIVLSVIAVFAFGAMTGLTLFTNRVYITDGEDVKCILTTQEDANMILAENNYVLGNDDGYAFSGFENGTGTITVFRGYEIPLTADGATKNISVHSGLTVEEALVKNEIFVGDDDLINIGLQEKINPNTDITIQRVEVREVETYSLIPFQYEQHFTANLKEGTTEVLVEGEEGRKTTLSRNTYIDGVLSESVPLSETVTKEPVTQVMQEGICPGSPIAQIAPEGAIAFDENGKPLNYSKVLTGKATAYSARPGAKTASGRYAIVGHVAVDPKIIPYGTPLYIVSTNGKHVYGYCIAADTGIGLLDGRVLVDLFMESYEASCKWGAKQVNIYVLN